MSKRALVSVILIVTVLLTVWQIIRGISKLPPQTIPQEIHYPYAVSSNNHLDFLTLSGHFVNQKVFIKPKVNEQHAPGNQVWVPFISQDNKCIIVSLGFQKNIEIPNEHRIRGTIYFISKPPFRLNNHTSRTTFPITVGQLDLERFSKELGRPVEPYIIILEGSSEQSLALPSLDRALRHFSYAGQFALMGIIAALYCTYVRKTRNTLSNKKNAK